MLMMMVSYYAAAQVTVGSVTTELNVSSNAPVVNCTAMKFCFALSNSDDDEVEDLTIRLFLRENLGFTFVDNPGFTLEDTGVALGSGGFAFDQWEITVNVPGIDDPEDGVLQVCARIVQTVTNVNFGNAEVFYQTALGQNESDIISGPSILNNPTFVTVGTASTDVTLFSTVATTVANNDVLVNGTLRINEAAVFDDNQFLYMMPGSSIEVVNGSVLTIVDAVKIEGCQELWEGINVVSGSLIMDGSTDASTPDRVVVKDAFNAVIAHSGTTIRVNNCLFQDNLVSISTPDLTTGANVVDFMVTDNIFETLHGLHAPLTNQPALAGASLFDLSLFYASTKNTYRDMTFGILGMGSNIQSTADRFKNIHDTGINAVSKGNRRLVQVGLSMDENDPSFLNCNVGIRVNNMHLSSRSNVMQGVNTGISLRGGVLKDVEIVDNTINAARTGVAFNYWRPLSNIDVRDNIITIDGHLQEGSAIFSELLFGINPADCRFRDNEIILQDARHGIWLNTTSRMGVRNNEVTFENQMEYGGGINIEGSSLNNLFCNLMTGTDITNYQQGIRLSESAENTLNCNTTDDTQVGMLVLGQNLPTVLRGNNFYTHYRALQVGDENGTIGGVTGIQNHNGNRWQETYGSGAAGYGHYGSPSQRIDSRHTYDEDDGSNLTTNVWPTTVTLFDETGGNTYSCSGQVSGCPPDPEGFEDEITGTDELVAGGQIAAPYYVDAQAWTAKRQLYRRLLRDQGMIVTGSVIDTFFTDESTTTVGAFEELGLDMEALYEIGDSLKTLMLADDSTLQVRMDEFMIELSHLDTSTVPSVIDSLHALQLSIQVSIAELDSVQSLREDALQGSAKSAAYQLLSVNAAITTTEVFEANQAKFNQAFLETIVYEQDTLTQAQVDTLTAIAEQCPYAGGEAVYQARALLGDGTYYDDVARCQPPQPLRKADNLEVVGFTATPNPASSYLSIQLDEEPATGGKAVLRNALGTIVAEQAYAAKEQQFFLLLDGVPSGTYFLTILPRSGIADTQTISIIK